MAQRTEIELTSQREDGTWTWRAAGARQPKGVVSASLLPAEISVGTVLRAEVEVRIDGIAVLAVLPQRERREPTARLELRKAGLRPPGITRSAPGKPAQRIDVSSEPGEVKEHETRGDRSHSEDRRGSRRDADQGSFKRSASTRREGKAREQFQVGNQHRQALMATLRPEQIPVAEQLLRGGIPAVRRAIEEQNARAKAGAGMPVAPQALLAMAEDLVARVNQAAWLDRAEAALRAPESVPLRDLRAVVAGASAVTLDETGREIAEKLRAALQQRIEALRQQWLDGMRSSLDAGKVEEALLRSARAPDRGARFPADIAVRLASEASRAMSSDLDSKSWGQLLEAVLGSPVKRTVKPEGLPSSVDPDLLERCRQAAGQVPALAALLGLPVPPPPGPPRPGPKVPRRPARERKRVGQPAPNLSRQAPKSAPPSRGDDAVVKKELVEPAN